MAIRINPAPTFKAKVRFTQPGDGEAVATLEFRHKTPDALAVWRAQLDKQPAAQSLAEVVAGWDAADFEDDAGAPVPFSPEAFALFLSGHSPRAEELALGYFIALTESRVKNSLRPPAA